MAKQPFQMASKTETKDPAAALIAPRLFAGGCGSDLSVDEKLSRRNVDHAAQFGALSDTRNHCGAGLPPASGCLFDSTVLIVIRAQFDGGAMTVRVTAREVAVRPPAVTMTLT